MNPVNDPELLRQLGNPGEVGFNAPSTPPASAAPAVDEDAWVWKTDDASIWEATKAKVDTAIEAFWASQAGEKHSNYANARLKKKAEETKAEMEKLGTVGQMAVSAANVPLVVGAGMINPYLGAATASGLYTGDILAQQALEGQKPDLGSAVLGGTATGLADLATGGLASKAKYALPMMKPATSAIARGGINVAEDATSAMAGQMATNLATGKDATENLGDAALMGAVGGQAVRGLVKGAQGAKDIISSPEARASVRQGITDLLPGGPKVRDDFVNDVADQQIRTTQLFDDLSTKTDDADIDADIDKIIEASTNGGRSASAKAIKILSANGMPITDASMGAKIPSSLRADAKAVHLGEDLAGLSLSQIRKEEQIALDARRGGFGTDKDVEAGLTKREHEALIQEGYTTTAQHLTGTFTTNKVKIEEMLAEGLDSGQIVKGDELYQQFNTSLDALRKMEKMTQKVSTRNKGDISESMAYETKRLLKAASKAGFRKDLVDEFGEAGRWNPLETMQTFNAAEIIARNQMPSLHQGTPRDPSHYTRGGMALDIGLMATGNIPAALARRGAAWTAGKVGDMRSRGKLKGSIKKGSKRAQELQAQVDAAVKSKLGQGDLAGAAAAAGADLSSKGIATGRPATDIPRRPKPEVEQPVEGEFMPGGRQQSEQAKEFEAEFKAQQEAEAAAGKQAEAEPKAEEAKAEEPKAEPKPKEKLKTVERPEPPKRKSEGEMSWKDKAEMIKQRNERELIEKIIGNSEDSALREHLLAEMGSVKGLREKIAGSNNKKESAESYFNREFRKFMDERKKAETDARTAEREKETQKKADEKAARDHETYMDDLNDYFKRNKISDEHAQAAMKEYLGEGEKLTRELRTKIKQHAKDLKSEADAKAKSDAETKAKADAETMAKADLTNQRKKVTQTLNAVKGAGPEFEAVRDSIQGQMKRATKALSDTQLESIHKKVSDAVNAEIKRLQIAYRKSGDSDALDRIDGLRKAIGQSQKTVDGMRAELEAAREAAARTEADAKAKAEDDAKAKAQAEREAADAEESAKTAREEALKETLKNQRSSITRALNAAPETSAAYKAARDSIQNRMKRAKKPLSDAELESMYRKIESSVNDEIDALSKEYKKSGNEKTMSQIEGLRKAIKQSKDTIEQMRDELKTARAEQVKAEEAAAKRRQDQADEKAQREKQAANEEMIDKSNDYGVDAGLNSKEIKSLRKKATIGGQFDMNKFKKLVDELVGQRAAKQQKAYEKKFEGASEEELKKYANDLVNEDLRTPVTDADLKAQLDALEKLGKEGKKVSPLVKTYGDAMKLAKSRKEAFPKNPELWLSRDTIDAVQLHMGKEEGGQYSGSVGARLRAKIYGTDKRRNLMTEEAIQEFIEKKSKRKGKLEGGDIKEMMKGRNTVRLRRMQK